MTMREISKWAVRKAFGGDVPRFRSSYTKDNTKIISENRTWENYPRYVIPWDTSKYNTWMTTFGTRDSVNAVELFGNKILWYNAIDGKICHLKPIVYWTMAGHDTVTTRERLNAFGIKLERKRGRTFWHKPNGEVVEVHPDVVYTIHGRYIVSHAIQEGIIANHLLDYVQVTRNKRRRLKPTA
jgi:hypothetical protein